MKKIYLAILNRANFAELLDWEVFRLSEEDAHISRHAGPDGDHLWLPHTTDKASRLGGDAAALVAEDVQAVRQEEAESRGRTLATPLQQLWQLEEFEDGRGRNSYLLQFTQ